MVKMSIAVLVAILFVGAVSAENKGSWTMIEVTVGKADATVEYLWTDMNESRTLTLRKGDRVQSVAVDKEDSAVAWQKPGFDLTRTRGSFILKTSDGTKTFESQALPWYQSLPQLAGFARAPESKTRFLVFPDNLDAQLKANDMTVFLATKTKREELILPIGKADCWKVRVTFDDFRSMFWGGDYWFRISDGLLVKYEEVRGGPGTPKTIGTILSWNKP